MRIILGLFALLALAGCDVVGTNPQNRNGACVVHSDCPGDQACAVDALCVDTLERAYTVKSIEVSACNTDIEGTAWDVDDGTAPDLQFEISFEGEVIYDGADEGDLAADSLDAVARVGTEAFILKDSDRFVVRVFDADDFDRELMGEVIVDVSLLGLRIGSLSETESSDCTRSGVQRVTLDLSPAGGDW
jgi:hypothetical protein